MQYKNESENLQPKIINMKFVSATNEKGNIYISCEVMQVPAFPCSQRSKGAVMS